MKKEKKKRNHLAWKARGTTSERGVASGVGAAETAGELLQMGHVALIRSHSSMQSAWKQWLHSGIDRTVSLGRYSDRQMEHGPSLGLGSRRLWPSTIFGYDSIAGPSRPATTTTAASSDESTAVDSRFVPGLPWSARVPPLALTLTQA